MADYDYNALLTPGVWRGNCGQREILENPAKVSEKAKKLAKWISKSKHLVVFTGAGISTSAGIPDFRGPKGVWTLEEKVEKGIREKNCKTVEQPKSVRFQDALPTKTHMALAALEKASILKYLISQNVDGLHMASGFPREKLSELHGNVFMICCQECGQEFLSDEPVRSVGFKKLDMKCNKCNGTLRDCTLDWNDNLPLDDFEKAKENVKKADLCICLGSSLQVTPAADLPLKTTKKNGKKKPGKLVIINLQKTPRDSWGNLLIHYYVDDVMSFVMKFLDIEIPSPLKLPISEHSEKFCKKRDQNWVGIQLDKAVKEEEEEEEEEEDSFDNSTIPSESDPEWQPNVPQKRATSTRSSQRKKAKIYHED